MIITLQPTRGQPLPETLRETLPATADAWSSVDRGQQPLATDEEIGVRTLFTRIAHVHGADRVSERETVLHYLREQGILLRGASVFLPRLRAFEPLFSPEERQFLIGALQMVDAHRAPAMMGSEGTVSYLEQQGLLLPSHVSGSVENATAAVASPSLWFGFLANVGARRSWYVDQVVADYHPIVEAFRDATIPEWVFMQNYPAWINRYLLRNVFEEENSASSRVSELRGQMLGWKDPTPQRIASLAVQGLSLAERTLWLDLVQKVLRDPHRDLLVRLFLMRIVLNTLEEVEKGVGEETVDVGMLMRLEGEFLRPLLQDPEATMVLAVAHYYLAESLNPSARTLVARSGKAIQPSFLPTRTLGLDRYLTNHHGKLSASLYSQALARLWAHVSFGEVRELNILEQVRPSHALSDYHPDVRFRKPRVLQKMARLADLVQRYGDDRRVVLDHFLNHEQEQDVLAALHFGRDGIVLIQGHHRAAALLRGASLGVIPKAWLRRVPVYVGNAGTLPPRFFKRVLTQNAGLSWSDLFPQEIDPMAILKSVPVVSAGQMVSNAGIALATMAMVSPCRSSLP